MNLPLRQKMILRVVLAVTFILVLSGIVLNHFVTTDIQSRFNNRLLDRAQILSSAVESGPTGLLIDFQEFDLKTTSDSDYVQLSGPGQIIYYLSPSTKGTPLVIPAHSDVTVSYSDTKLEDDTLLRCVHLVFYPEIEDENEDDPSEDKVLDRKLALVLTIGRNTNILTQTLTRFHAILAGVALATLLVLVLALLTLIRSTLAPVETLAGRIASLDPEKPDEELSSSGIPLDFQPIVKRLNEMLGKLRDSLDREKTFSADFSHEMRTPLAGQKNMGFRCSVQPDLSFTLNRPLFALAVRNVFDNAVSYGQADSLISILGVRDLDGFSLEVSNLGCRLTQQEAEELRARFRRGDPNRESAGGHSGLGLALVDSIAQNLGFQVSIQVDADGRYRIKFFFGTPRFRPI